jgi:lactate permease
MSLARVLLAAAPILLLLVAILGFKINTVISGIAAACLAAAVSLLVFGGNWSLLLVAAAKGLSLSLFVLLIIWTSLYLYHLMQSLGLMQAIALSISRISVNRLGLALLLAWTFAGFIEGIAGFGVPAAVLAPLMMVVGFSPLTSVVAVLVGHSWAVTFGGMAGAYYTLQLATGLQSASFGPVMGFLFTLPVITTGLMVAHVHGGWVALRKAFPAVLIIGLAMAAVLWLMIYLNAAQVAAVAAGLAGTVMLWLLSRSSFFFKRDLEAVIGRQASESSLSFHLAFAPYYLLIFLALLCQLPVFRQATSHLFLAFNYPSESTSLGYTVPPALGYAKILLFGHPAPIIAVSILVTILLFRRSRFWKPGIVGTTAKATFRQCLEPSLAIIAMVVMALIMNDSGMTTKIAASLAQISAGFYPVLSPFFGVLGTFMTGSNANSNVMFGALQTNAAAILGISPLVIASSQSIGGSLGAAIAPAKVLLGSCAVGLDRRESEILRRTLVYCLIAVLLVGLEVLVVVRLVHLN